MYMRIFSNETKLEIYTKAKYIQSNGFWPQMRMSSEIGAEQK